MPADISFPHVSATAIETPPRRLPVGIGLVIGAGVSIGLWFGIAAAVKTLFF